MYSRLRSFLLALVGYTGVTRRHSRVFYGLALYMGGYSLSFIERVMYLLHDNTSDLCYARVSLNNRLLCL